jgi:Ca-activated chloride channel homolog
MKKYPILFLLTLLIPMLALAQRTVTGRVTDAQDGSALPGVNVIVKGTTTGSTTDARGNFDIKVPGNQAVLVFSFIGYSTLETKVGEKKHLEIRLHQDIHVLEEVVTTGIRIAPGKGKKMESTAYPYTAAPMEDVYYQPHNTEEYDGLEENIFHQALKNPLSTFSIDVDAASYSTMRRFIQMGQMPPANAVRIEEMINYFHYTYKQPKGEHPFSIHTEMGAAPWNPSHKLVHIGLQGKDIPKENLPSSNLVFLIDVSGSMYPANRLPLLKTAFKMLVEELRPQDQVAIVVYAGAAGLVLPPTSGENKATIIRALDKLEAGGSTAGGAGLRLAYKVAAEQFKVDGNNRVILATDGDFNVGESSNAAMERLIEQYRDSGVYLTVLGFGMGNYKDAKMETLSNKGNGNYAYIDNIQEARKVLVTEFGGTLFTIAKDVKLQVEFNPAKVQAYRLIGYENRVMRHEDFNNDKKDAGDMGAGHSVTALYEIIPVGVKSSFLPIDDLKYQEKPTLRPATASDEWLTVKIRYKQPDGMKSKLLEVPLRWDDRNDVAQSENFRWSAAVAGFGMLLRQSEFKGNFTYDKVLRLAEGARGEDAEGYRVEFIRLVKSAKTLDKYSGD